MTKLVIFDFDGVIANSEIICLAELQSCLAEYGVSVSWEEMIERFLGSSLSSITDLLRDRHGRDMLDEFRARWYDRLFRRYRAELQPMTGIVALLDRLDASGISYCIASGSSSRRLNYALDCIALADRFAGRAYSAEELRRGKPEPDLMLLSAARHGAKVSDCLVIEDAVAGMRAARRAGMTGIGFVGGDHFRERRAVQADCLRAAGAAAVVERHADLQIS